MFVLKWRFGWFFWRTHRRELWSNCSLSREVPLTRDPHHTQALGVIPPPLSCSFSLSLPRQIMFQSTLKPLEHQSAIFLNEKKKKKLAPAGVHWHMLAHTGTRVEPTPRLPSRRGLPKKLQMTALSFSCPALPSPLLHSPPVIVCFSLPLSARCLYLLLRVR